MNDSGFSELGRFRLCSARCSEIAVGGIPSISQFSRGLSFTAWLVDKDDAAGSAIGLRPVVGHVGKELCAGSSAATDRTIKSVIPSPDEPAGQLEDRSFDVLIADRRYAGARAPALSIAAMRRAPFHHMPLSFTN